MSFFYRRSTKVQKYPEIIKALNDSIGGLSRGKKSSEKANDELTKDLAFIRAICSPNDRTAETDAQRQLLEADLPGSTWPMALVKHLHQLPLETKKIVVGIFGSLLLPPNPPMLAYLESNEAVLGILLRSYENPDIAINNGSILRDCIKFESLAEQILYSQEFYAFFRVLCSYNFDVASDGFSTFRELLITHKAITASFLQTHYRPVFASYLQLLKSDSYVTKRQSLKLLSELLLDRANFSVMTEFISYAENLKTVMGLLRDRSKQIKFEAFHVFKIFVANPNKPPEIRDILVKNRSKLLFLLSKFLEERDDQQFTGERNFVIKKVEELSDDDAVTDAPPAPHCSR